MRKKSSGFTLIEFLLVVMMFGALLAVILPRAQQAANEAKFSQAFQHGSEIAGYIVTWGQNQMAALPGNSSYTLKDVLMSELTAEMIGVDSYPEANRYLGSKQNTEMVGFRSLPLVNRYTGNDNYNTIEGFYPFEHQPLNPFNNKSYFDPKNDDREKIPSNKPGLLFLASVVTERLNQPYRYFYLLLTATDEKWYGGTGLEAEQMRRGIFVAQMPEVERKEYLGER